MSESKTTARKDDDFTHYFKATQRLKKQLEIAVQGLRDVIDPVAKVQREMPDGYRLDGRGAVDMLRLPATYQQIAKDALKKLRRNP